VVNPVLRRLRDFLVQRIL